MKNSTKTLIITSVIVFAGAFIRTYFDNSNNQTKFVEKKVNDLYCLIVPSYLSETDRLNEVASFQGYNKKKHAYITIIDDVKTGLYTLEDYNELVVEPRYQMGFDDIKFMNKEKTEINNFEAIQYNIEANSNNETIYALFTLIEGTNDFYQIMIWTSLKNNELFFSEMELTIKSFKECKIQ